MKRKRSVVSCDDSFEQSNFANLCLHVLMKNLIPLASSSRAWSWIYMRSMYYVIIVMEKRTMCRVEKRTVDTSKALKSAHIRPSLSKQNVHENISVHLSISFNFLSPYHSRYLPASSWERFQSQGSVLQLIEPPVAHTLLILFFWIVMIDARDSFRFVELSRLFMLIRKPLHELFQPDDCSLKRNSILEWIVVNWKSFSRTPAIKFAFLSTLSFFILLHFCASVHVQTDVDCHAIMALQVSSIIN